MKPKRICFTALGTFIIFFFFINIWLLTSPNVNTSLETTKEIVDSLKELKEEYDKQRHNLLKQLHAKESTGKKLKEAFAIENKKLIEKADDPQEEDLLKKYQAWMQKKEKQNLDEVIMEHSFKNITHGQKIQENWPFDKRRRVVIIIVTTKKNLSIFNRFRGQQKTWLSQVDREKDLVLVVSDDDIQDEFTLIDPTRSPRFPEKDYYHAQFRFLHGIEWVFTNGLKENGSHLFDWIFVVDDDTYVFWGKFEKRLNTLDFERNIVVGRSGKIEDVCDRVCGGSGWLASYKFVSTFSSFWSKMMNSRFNNYDYKLSRFWKSENIIGDENFQYTRGECDENSAITCHYITKHMMHQMYDREQK